MKRKHKKQEEHNYVACAIVGTILMLTLKGCSDFCSYYCEKHHDEWETANRQRAEQKMQEAYYNCKFEHDY